jgi:hypothetical protein
VDTCAVPKAKSGALETEISRTIQVDRQHTKRVVSKGNKSRILAGAAPATITALAIHQMFVDQEAQDSSLDRNALAKILKEV